MQKAKGGFQVEKDAGRNAAARYYVHNSRQRPKSMPFIRKAPEFLEIFAIRCDARIMDYIDI